MIFIEVNGSWSGSDNENNWRKASTWDIAETLKFGS
jgi:hypothetical protein